MPPAALLWLACLPAVHDTDSGFPNHFESVEVASGINTALDLAFLPDGRFLLTGKAGLVHFHDGTFLQPAPVLDITAEVVQTGDRGLIGLALHPGFVPDGGATSWIYLAYTVSPVFGQDPVYNDDDKYSFSRVTRYRVDFVDGDLLAQLPTREVLLGNQLPDGTVPDGIASLWSSHAVGTLLFGTDGSLLISAGDGGHADQQDPGGLDTGGFSDFVHPVTGLKGPMSPDQDCGVFRAQDLRTLAGKILRAAPETGFGYPSNPFYDGDPTSLASRIWALGLRNPYRMKPVPGTGSTNPADGDPGSVLVGDVGWSTWEELNVCAGAENFGWPCFEGNAPQAHYPDHEFSPNPFAFPDCDNLGPGVLTGPLLTWNQSDPALVQPGGIHFNDEGQPQPGFTGSAALGGVAYPGGEYPPEFTNQIFFADYADNWIRTLVLDGQGDPIEVRDFAFDIDRLVDLEVHPVTGDIHYVGLGLVHGSGHVSRIRYGLNLTPTAVATAVPPFGDPPLSVDFDSAGSSDPEGDPVTYTWDFGDGSPTVNGSTAQHLYTVEGLYPATLTVTDDGGLSDVATTLVAVGDVPPIARILAPLPGTAFTAGDTLEFSGDGFEFSGGPLEYDWAVDLYHDTHVHPDLAVFEGPTAAYLAESHGSADELFYLRVELTVTSEAGLEGRSHVFLYPAENLLDASGRGELLSRVHELVPPYPTGVGNPDPEVMRDGDQPPVGSADRQRQYDTLHGGDQGEDDWVGVALPAAPEESVRFVGVNFQEGIHYLGGGWFEDLTVEVRDDDVWTEVSDLSVFPSYPFADAGTPGFDGVSFESYALHFDPIHGDALRIRGTPGGADGFISVGELRVQIISPIDPSPPWIDLTDGANIISRLGELVPPFPLGSGSKDPQTIRNGTWPPVGSTSLFAQIDSFHNGDQGDDDWIGYSFAEWQTLERVLFQEGRHQADGGWFDDMTIETRPDTSSAWQPAAGLSVSPPVPGDTTPAGSYETFEFTFAPTVARQVRVSGTPGGAQNYISTGELRVFGPGHDAETCGWSLYGEGLGGLHQLSLNSTTPPLMGYPAAISTTGLSGAGAGFLLYSSGSAALPVLGGTLLVNPLTFQGLPLSFDAAGRCDLLAVLPDDPRLSGLSLYFQTLAASAAQPNTPLFSNGLQITFCP